MFECKGCEAHSEEIKFLREQVKSLTELLAKANPLVSAPKHLDVAGSALGYFGDGQDQYIQYDQYGQKILVEEDLKLHELQLDRD